MILKQKLEAFVAVGLVLCIVLVVGWLIASKMAARSFEELRLGGDDFEAFTPQSDQWAIRLMHVKATPTEPTAIAYVLRATYPDCPAHAAPLLVRMVHGYNMVDCMRIKHYDVKRLADTRTSPPILTFDLPDLPFSSLPVQIWRLTSPMEERSIWATSMLRAADFSATDVDTRDMAFPRVGTPDDPAWAPTGLKWSSFKHPIRNARRAIRSRWNASRCDIWTFLRLRQPAWASNEMLTLVTEYRGPSVAEEQEDAVAQYVLQAHAFMLNEFQRFWRHRTPTETDRQP